MAKLYNSFSSPHLKEFPISKHIEAMMEENLSSVTDIATELAHRDWIILRQRKEIEQLKSQLKDYDELFGNIANEQ